MFQKFQRVCPSPNLLELPIYLRVLGPQGNVLSFDIHGQNTNSGGLYKATDEKGPSYYRPLVFIQNSKEPNPF